MVARSGGYFGPPYKVQLGVTQEDPLSPTIFNVVIDAVLRHCILVLAEVKTEEDIVLEGFG